MYRACCSDRALLDPPPRKSSAPRQRRLLEMALAPNDPEDGWLTAKRAARQTKVERVTGSRDLARMEQLGVIEKDPAAGGRSTRYRVRLSESLPSRLIKELNWTTGPDG
jgi:predicted transcriptional regulator